jgi:monoamine oxidase
MDYIQGDYFVLREGLSELCNRMFKQIKGKGILNHSVKRIERVDDYLEVDGYRAQRVIVTIPPIRFKNFHILSPYKEVISYLKGPPLLRIYAKYPTPYWFESLNKMTTQHELRHIIPIHDGIIMIAYVEDTDISPFVEKGKLKPILEIEKVIENVLGKLFPTLTIPPPLWIRPYLWEIGTHAWLPGNSTKLLETLPVIECVYVCGEAFSMRQSWIEGALESAEGVLKKLGV